MADGLDSLSSTTRPPARGQIRPALPGATRTEIWDRVGRNPADLDPDRTMDVDELVDAALAGLDKGLPNLSNAHPAPRYGVTATVTA